MSPRGSAHLSQVREEIKEPTAAGESSAYCNIIHWQNSKKVESEESVSGSFFFEVLFLYCITRLSFFITIQLDGRAVKVCTAELNCCLLWLTFSGRGGVGVGGYSVSSSFPKSRLSVLLPCPWMVTVEMQRRWCVAGWMDMDRLNAF